MVRERFTPNTRFALLLVCLLMISWSGFVASSTPIKAAPGDTIVYVNQAATGANNGTSWQNAYTDLQTALTAAQPNHSIWIAQGIYRPTSDLSDLAVARTISFEIPNGVELYGGFAGNEAELAERDWELNKTILSGDLEGNDITDGGVITTTTAIVGVNTRNILKISNADQSTVLDGLIITGGQTQASDADPYLNGAGIHIQLASPTLRNLIFSGNSARNGGAISNVYNSSPSISNASFFGNSARIGGAISNVNNSNPSISNTTFFGNSASWGGALNNEQNSKPTITNVSFFGNQATYNGGAIENYYNSSLIINNVTFFANSAQNGGAINTELNSNTVLSNSIIWGNSSSISLVSSSNLTITYSLVQGCDPVGGWAADCGNDDGGNLSPTDPLFVNPSALTSTGDLHLQAGSPAIDKGNNALNSTTIDLDGKPRIGNGVIDLGAYEFGYQLKKSIVGNGEISHTPNTNWHLPDTTVTITATASPGWSFAGWSGDLSGSSSPTSLLINDAKQITATFTNDPPTANAGSDQTVVAGTQVTLDGSASFDADPTQTLSYAWTQTGGPSVALSDPSAVSPSFTPTISGALTFELIVTDSLGVASSADSVIITITNDAPIANAGSDQTVVAGSTVALDGSGSSDPDGHMPLTYAWTQTTGTPVTLSDSSAISPTFTAPSEAGVLTFELIVTDRMGLVSIADSVTITVTNGEPVANAGSDQSVVVATQVTLDGSASSDPDGHVPLSYSWTQTAGPSVSLAGANTAQATFTAPSEATTLIFELIVSDSMGLVSTADSVTITVEKPIYTVYLPQVLGQEQRPNLVVSELSADQNGIRVVIENRGDAATQAGFWVDVFMNPRQVPSSNTVWQEIASVGAVWAVKQPLEPGQSLTLTQTSPFYVSDYSFGSFEAGAQLYAYVDSYHSSNSYGVELEHNESDNLFGPIAASAAGKMRGPAPSQAGLYQGLPIR